MLIDRFILMRQTKILFFFCFFKLESLLPKSFVRLKLNNQKKKKKEEQEDSASYNLPFILIEYDWHTLISQNTKRKRT